MKYLTFIGLFLSLALGQAHAQDGYAGPIGTGGGGGGAVSSVSNSDGSLTISPTTGAVVASINLANSNTFTVPQAINLNAAAIPTVSNKALLSNCLDATGCNDWLFNYGAFGGFNFARGDTSGAAPSALQSGDIIGRIQWGGWYGAGANFTADAAHILVQAAPSGAAWTTGDRGTALGIYLSNPGANSVSLYLDCNITTAQKCTYSFPVALTSATGTSLALGGCTIGSQAFCETGAASLNGVETILSGGNIGFGTETNPQGSFVFSKNSTSGIAGASTGAILTAIGADSAGAGFSTLTFGANGANSFSAAGGTGASPLSTTAAMGIGSIGFGGYVAGTGFTASKARILGFSLESGVFSGTNQGTGIEFDTTPAGSTSRAQAGRFMAGFIVGTGTTDPGAGNLDIGGRSTIGSATLASGQAGDLGLIKETDAAAAPGAGYAVLKWVAGSGTSCNLIAYAGTSSTPVTIASTVGSGC